ncbi:hypothetical protein AcW1_000158 [Taiwanofungus camphoratus]|nr:hypothetical protein AcW2_001349 [Antrodia cinnamomea]KAI0962935.1 hypothetical protein AcW1_000158 [Antrodia cinnamomea]
MAPTFNPSSYPTGSHYTAGDSQVTGTPSTGTSPSRGSGGTPSGRPAPYPVPDARGSQTQAQVEALRLARCYKAVMVRTYIFISLHYTGLAGRVHLQLSPLFLTG